MLFDKHSLNSSAWQFKMFCNEENDFFLQFQHKF